MVALSPPQIVENLLEELAYNSDTPTPLKDLWGYVKNYVPNIDDMYKTFVWTWLNKKKHDFRVLANAQDIPDNLRSLPYPKLIEHYSEESLSLIVAEEVLWLKITGVPKSKSELGEYPFKLLCRIAKAREEGITSSKLAKETNQDSRSITGRLNLLIKLGLIRKYSVISNGCCTYASVYKKFTWIHRDTEKPGAKKSKAVVVDKKLIRRKVVESCKLAPNGIRFFMDMVEEFGIRRVRLVSLLARLSNEGYVEQLLMCRDDNPNGKFICVKYLKDLPLSDDPNEEMDEDDDEDEDEAADNADNEEGEGMEVPGENVAPSDLSKMHQVDPSDSVANGSPLHHHKFNLVYSLSNQIFSLVNDSDSVGIPGGVILNELGGPGFFRVINRELDLLVGSLSAKDLKQYSDTPIGHLIVVRGVDFSARIKYYRYFSNAGYASLNNLPVNPMWGEYFQESGKFSTLAEMEKARYKPLPGRAIIIDENGQKETIFYGGFLAARKDGKSVPISVKPPTKTGKKRGRPRKDEAAKKKQRTIEEQPAEASDSSVAATANTTTNEISASEVNHNNLDTTSSTADNISPSALNFDASQTTDPALLHTGIPEMDSAAVDPRIQTPEREQPTELDNPLFPKTPIIKEDTSNQPDYLLPPNTTQEVSTGISSSSQFVPITKDNDGDVEMVGSTKAGESSTPTLPAGTSGSQATSAALLGTTRWRPPPRTKAFSLGDKKRHNQILDLLDSHDGVYEHGVEFLRIFDEAYREENGSTMDRKTYSKAIKALCDQDILRIIYITFPNMSRQGAINITKSLILRSEIPNDDPRIEKGKATLRENLEKWKRRGYHNVDRKTENGNFVVVTQKYKDIIKRSSERYMEKSQLVVNDRLKLADMDLQETRKADKRKKKKKATVEGGSSTAKPQNGKTSKPSTRSSKSSHKIKAKTSRPSPRDTAKQDDAPKKKKRRKSRKIVLPESNDPLVMRTPNTSLGIIRTSLKRSLKAERSEQDVSKSDLRAGSRPNQENRVRLDLVIKDIEIYVRVITMCRSFTPSGAPKFDWKVITRELKHWYPEVDEHEARRVWKRGRIRLGGIKTINTLSDSWSKIFERGYESGEIKLMDPEDLDIPYLVEYWTEKSPMLKDPDDSPLLFEIKEEFEKHYIIVPGKYTSSHDAALTFGKSMIAVGDALANWAMAFPRSSIEPRKSISKVLESSTTAIKAVIATPEAEYDSNVARDVLRKYNDDTINRAMKILDAEKVIVYIPRDVEKVRPGRNFMFSEKFMSTISARVNQDFVYTISQSYKSLKSLFAQNRGRLLSSDIQDEDMPCIIDLISTQQADLIPVHSQKKENTSSRKGMRSIGNRRTAIEQNEFDLVIRTHVDSSSSSSSSSLESYEISKTYGPSNPRASTITRIARPAVQAPSGQPCQYIWIGVKGLLSFPIFERLIQWLIVYFTNHPGAAADNVHSVLEKVITLEEVQALLNWLVLRRILEEVHKGGYRLLSGWYFNIFASSLD